jgi:hypothetical protein
MCLFINCFTYPSVLQVPLERSNEKSAKKDHLNGCPCIDQCQPRLNLAPPPLGRDLTNPEGELV